MDKKLALVHGNIYKSILTFALPIFIGQVFQQLYNLADAVVVGNFVGETALAAVTSTGSLIFLLVGFFMGVFTGVSVIISRFIGAQEKEKVQRAVHTAVAFGCLAGLLLTAIGVLFCGQILTLMGTPDEVFAEAQIYLRTYFSGVCALVLYNVACGIYQAVGDSKRPLYYLMISSVVNVLLDLLFVGAFDWGVRGAALATVSAQGLSAILAFARLMRIDADYKITLRHITLDLPLLKEMLRIGIPSGVQNSVIAFANLVVQASINSFGAQVVAGHGAYTKIEGFAFIPITAFSQAVTIFVSQNIGAQKFDRVKKGANFGVAFACIVAQSFGIFFALCAPTVIGLFGEVSPETLAFAVQRAGIGAWFYILLAYSHGTASVLRGAGHAMVPMVVMLVCWCVMRVGYIYIVTTVYHDIALVCWAYPITWGLSSIVFFFYYHKTNWLRR
ncbi:MAG: MATE family efflux transporter [Faecalibacterium sp.]